jgi:putative toxin-antitoxin system antitoxin component (TIGR02293 family)
MQWMPNFQHIMSSVSANTALQNVWSILMSRLRPGGDVPRSGRAGGAEAMTREASVIPSRLSAGQAYTLIKAGVPSRTLTPLGEYLGLGKGVLAGYLDLDRATGARRPAKDEMLPAYAAENMLRLLELDSLAKETFETAAEAAGWMRQSHPMLGGESPLGCAKSGFGTQRVKDILVAIRYGGVV